MTMSVTVNGKSGKRVGAVLLVIVIVAVLAVSASSLLISDDEDRTFSNGMLTYRVTGDGVTVIGWDATGTDITIPDTVTDGTTEYDVTSIDRNAFAGTNITSISIGCNVSDIDGTMFDGCASLTDITVSDDNPTYASFNDGSLYYRTGVLMANPEGLLPLRAAAVAAEGTVRIKTDSGGNGIVRPMGEFEVNVGYVFDISFMADPGYKLNQAFLDGKLITPTVTSIKLECWADHTVYATFIEDIYDINVQKPVNGVLSPTGVNHVPAHSDFTVTITSDPGYRIKNLIVDGVTIGPATTYTFSSVEKNHWISAVMERVTYIMTATQGEGGQIGPAGTWEFPPGSNVVYTIIPDNGMETETLIIDGVSVPLARQYKFMNLQADHTITATFVPSANSVWIESEGPGKTIPTGRLYVREDSNLTVLFQPDEGYEVHSLVVDGVTIIPDGNAYTFFNIKGEHKLDVLYGNLKLKVTADAGPNGTITPNDLLVNYGTEQKFVIDVTDDNFSIKEINVNGTSIPIAKEFTLTIREDTHVKVIISRDTYNLELLHNSEGGRLAPSGEHQHAEVGKDYPIWIRPASGYRVGSLILDGIPVEFPDVTGQMVYTLKNVTSDHVFEVKFVKIEYTIKASVHGEGGTIDPVGTITVLGTDSITFNFTITDDDYELNSIRVDGILVANRMSYTFTNVTADHEMRVGFSKKRVEVHAMAGPNGTIEPHSTPSSVLLFNVGSTALFKITPDEGFKVSDVTVNGESVGTITVLTLEDMRINYDITVTFEGIILKVTPSAGPNGTITPGDVQMLKWKDSITFTITPDPHHKISDVIVDGVSVGAVTEYKFTDLTEDHTINALFEPIIFKVSLTTDRGGYLYGARDVISGESPTYFMASEVHYYCTGIFVNGVRIDPSPFFAVEITKDTTIHAAFSPITYTINASATQGGSISPFGSVVVNSGSSQTFTITPNAHYVINDVVVDGVSKGKIGTYTFQDVGADHSISVSFSPIQYTVTISSGSGGKVSPSGTRTVMEGSSLTVDFSANRGHLVADIIVDGINMGPLPTKSYTFNDIHSNHVFRVVFAPIMIPIVVANNVGGVILGPVLVAYGSDAAYVIVPDDKHDVGRIYIDGIPIPLLKYEITIFNVTSPFVISASYDLVTHTIHASAGPGGSISPSGSVSVTNTLTKAFTITADQGYRIFDVTYDGVSYGAISQFITPPVLRDHTLRVTFARLMVDVLVVTEGPGTVFPAAGTHSVPKGDDMVFTINPDMYHHFTVYVDGVKSTDITETGFVLPAVTTYHEVKIVFERDVYTLTVLQNPGGTIAPDTHEILGGGSAMFQITPDKYFEISYVEVDGESKGVMSTYTFDDVVEDHYIMAIFKRTAVVITPSWTGDGEIVPSEASEYPVGADTEFTITPAKGSYIVDVIVDGVSKGPLTSYVFEKLDDDHSISAVFDEITYIITAGSNTGGTMTPTGEVTVKEGGTQGFMFTLDDGYHVHTITVDGVAVELSQTSYVFENVTENHTINVEFASMKYTITATVGENGRMEPGTTEVYWGTDLKFKAFPDTGYMVESFFVDGSRLSGSDEYEFTNITDNHTIHVIFKHVPLKLTATAGPGGTVTPEEMTIEYGGDLLFIFHPETGYVVDRIYVDEEDVGSGNWYKFTNVIADHTLSVTFKVAEFQIDAAAGPGGSISDPGVTIIQYGGSKEYTITPDDHYFISEIFIDGIRILGKDATYLFDNVISDHSISVTFEKETFRMEAIADGFGTITPEGIVFVGYGESIRFEFEPDEHFILIFIVVDDVRIDTDDMFYTFDDVTGEHTIRAVFDAILFDIVVTQSPNGTISPDGTVKVLEGRSKEFTITPAEHYRIKNVKIDETDLGNVSTYTFTDVTSDHTITAEFEPIMHTITASAGTNGTISPNGAVEVAEGTSQTFTFIPDTGYMVDAVCINGDDIGYRTSFTFPNVVGDNTIEVTFKTAVYAILSTAGAGGSISPSGITYVTHGDSIEYTIAAETGFTISKVFIDGVETAVPGTEYTFSNVDGEHAITVIFENEKYIITPVADGNGTITPADAAEVEHGGSVKFTFTPDPHHMVYKVYVDDVEVTLTDVDSYTFENVTGSHLIKVTFKPMTYTVTVTQGENGTISPDGVVPVEYGVSQTFTIKAAPHYAIKNVRIDGTVDFGDVSSYTFSNVAGNHTITAEFEPIMHTVTVSAGANGTISPNGTVKVAEGMSQTFTFIPDAGYMVDTVTVDGVRQERTDSYTFSNVMASHGLEVTFKLAEYVVTASASVGGTIYPEGETTVEHGDSLRFTWLADEHYEMYILFVNGNPVAIPDEFYVLEDITGPVRVYAYFLHREYAISATSGDNGTTDPDGIAYVYEGDDVTFMFTPDPHYVVDRVTVDGVTIDGSPDDYTFRNVTEGHTIHVTFRLETFTIDVTQGANGKISPAGTVVVEYNMSRTFTITPAEHYRIKNVRIDGTTDLGSVPTYTFSNVTGNHTITAEFEPIMHTITASAGLNGTISPETTEVMDGASQTFTFTPDEGYMVGSVKVDDVLITDISGSYTFRNVTGAHTIEVEFTVAEYSVSVSANAGGVVSPTGEVIVTHGDDLTLTITPSEYYEVFAVYLDGTPVAMTDDTYVLSDVTAPHRIYVVFMPSMYYIDASAGANGTIAPKGAAFVYGGEDKEYVFTPDAHYEVDKVTVDGVALPDPQTSYKFEKVTGNHIISVTFRPIMHTVTVTQGANGTISPGTTEVMDGASQTFTITPAEHYRIKNVRIDGTTDLGNVSTHTFSDVTGNHMITAEFEPIMYTVTVTQSMYGTIHPGTMQVMDGASQTFNLIPMEHYRVRSVTIDGVRMGGLEQYTFSNVTGDHTITAEFEIIRHSIDASAAGDGTISPSGIRTVDDGKNITFTFTPSAYHQVADVFVDGVSVGASSSYTFSNVTDDHTITVYFEIITHTVTSSTDGNGTINPEGAASVDHGKDISFFISPDEGYEISGILIDGEPVGTMTSTFTFNDVTGDHTIHVTFTKIMFRVTAIADEHGTIVPETTDVEYGGNFRVEFSADTHYEISDVMIDGVYMGPMTEYTFNDVREPHIVRLFVRPVMYVITVTQNTGGNISPGGMFEVMSGSSQTFTFEPDEHYRIGAIWVNNTNVGSGTTYTITDITRNYRVTATFDEIVHNVSVTVGEGGSLMPSEDVIQVVDGDSITFLVTPDLHYRLDKFIVDGTEVDVVDGEYVLRNITDDVTISVTFINITYVIKATAGDNGAISPAGDITVRSGDSIEFDFTPDEGYSVAQVLVDGQSVDVSRAYKFQNVTSDHTIHVVFAENMFEIVPRVIGDGGSGTITPGTVTPVAEGYDQRFVFQANEHYRIIAVYIDGEPLDTFGDEYTFYNVKGDHTIGVEFRKIVYAVTATAGENGIISPFGRVEVESGGSVSFKIDPLKGYRISDVTVNGTSVGAVSEYTFTDVRMDYNINATFEKLTFRFTASAGANGSISPDGTTTVEYGGSVTYSITSDANYVISKVFVDGREVVAETNYTFENIVADRTIHVEFEPVRYVISATSTDNGTIDPEGEIYVSHGSDRRFVITPDEDSRLVDVIIDGVSKGPLTEYTFTDVRENHTINVVFEPILYTITVKQNDGGYIYPGTITVQQGTAPVMFVYGGYNYWIEGVFLDSEKVSLTIFNTYMFDEVIQDHTFEVRFALITHTITSSSGENGTISPDGETEVVDGGSIKYTMIPEKGYKVKDVLVNGESIGAVMEYTFTNVYEPQTISVTFEVAIHTVISEAYLGGSIDPAGERTYRGGESPVYLITADDGYKVVSVYIDGTDIGAVMEYTFWDIGGDHTIRVVFELITYDITATSEGDGGISPSGKVSVRAGADQEFMVYPDEHNVLKELYVDGEPASLDEFGRYIFRNVNGTHTIHAVFEHNEYVVSTTVSKGGSISPSGSAVFIKGTDAKFMITADNGYRIENVYVDGVSVGAVSEYVFTSISGDHEIKVVFAEDSSSDVMLWIIILVIIIATVSVAIYLMMNGRR